LVEHIPQARPLWQPRVGIAPGTRLLTRSARFAGSRDAPVAGAAIAMVAAMTGWTALSPATLYPLTAEDGPIETAQFLLYLGGALFFFRFWLAQRGKLRFGGALALIWVLALILIAGEEISWGQRLLGFATPENVVTANTQAEFNLHNMNAAYRIYGSDSKPMFLIELGLGVILPLFALTKFGGNICRAFSMPVPPAALIPLFAGANLFGHVFANHFLGLGFERTVTPEIAEFLLSSALCASGFLIMRRPETAFGHNWRSQNESVTDE
jgi:hypothetical protein